MEIAKALDSKYRKKSPTMKSMGVEPNNEPLELTDEIREYAKKYFPDIDDETLCKWDNIGTIAIEMITGGRLVMEKYYGRIYPAPELLVKTTGDWDFKAS